ncbi:hypothetical protein GCM10022237_05380 [Nocardioides ginsengisoli]|uniref:Bacteriocin biosynthesis cyclodehydratase domain-containing protein n=1 Tax=Nocardioides ginsengisoli TaxID=363868 RepID=A0ABW3VWD9_9ACTN
MSALGARHLILRPGTPVMARSPGVVQIGLAGPSACLPDDPAVRRLVDALRRPTGLDPAEALPDAAADALRRLQDADLVVAAFLGEEPRPRALTTLLAQFGPDAVRRHEARVATRVVVHAALALEPAVDALLAEAGLPTTSDGDDPDAVHLVVSAGEVHRDALDPLIRASRAHLLVGGDAAGVRIGPFVEPGRTACQRCVDAHESMHDPRRPLLLAQAAGQAAAFPAPRDPLLDRLALAWAVRDLQRYAEGDEPSTWSATVDLGPATAPTITPWGRHPYCGCSWDGFLDLP